MKATIACDNYVSFEAISFLEANGIKVPVWAGDMGDDEWLHEALENKCDFIVTNDKELQWKAKLSGLDVIELPDGVRGVHIGLEIIAEIKDRKTGLQPLGDSLASTKR